MSGSDKEITILLVDDIPETRENIKKLLAFEPDFKVIGAAGTGREGVEQALASKPDVIIMDINMPDMDGLTATSLISKQMGRSAVIIMSVQNDADYLRKAMRAGADDFLTKPINMDELYSTIRQVYKDHEAERLKWDYEEAGGGPSYMPVKTEESGERAGHVIAVYSPQGGAGVTTVATNIASGLMKENIKVLLIDADLQFADVGTFLNLQAQSSLVEVAEDVDDLDVELFDNIVVTHDSGLKVLLGPPRPEEGERVRARPDTIGEILSKIRWNYDYIVVDTSTMLDESLLGIFDQAQRVVLIGAPTLVSVKNLRFVLDLFDQLGYEPEKTFFILNRIWDDRKGKSVTFPDERIEGFLKRPVQARIPSVDERIILNAINKGVPVIASDRDQNKAPIKQLLEIAELLHKQLMGDEQEGEEDEENVKKPWGFLGR